MKLMKLMAIPIAALSMMLCSCTEENVSYMADSHWILKVDGVSVGHRLALTFHGDEMQVFDASYDTPPFADGVWNYYIDEDDDLYMSRTYSDGDDETTESYRLHCDVDEDFTVLNLVYDPWIGGSHIYQFERR